MEVEESGRRESEDVGGGKEWDGSRLGDGKAVQEGDGLQLKVATDGRGGRRLLVVTRRW